MVVSNKKFLPMKVRIKTFDNKPLFYETKGACAFDFRACEDVIISPWKMWVIDTWTVVEIPEWYAMVIVPRSSTYKNFWLIQVNGVWIIDNDFHWDNDTSKFQYLNMSENDIKVEKWTRIWQWMFVKIMKAEFEITNDTMREDNRWGLWTTGNK